MLTLPALRTKDPSYVDAVWGFGFVLVALATLLQTHGDPLRGALVVGLTCLWGLRLGGYLLWRWRQGGPDPRYQRMLARNTSRGGSAGGFLWRKVFLLQAVLLWVVSLPVQLGQIYSEPPGLSALNVGGALLALFGIAYETIADAQLVRFRAEPTNRGQVLDTGVWRTSRHPNYFGEACVWWGLWLLTVANVPTALGIVGPLTITALLLRWSGVGPLESQLTSSKPGYVDYIGTTSGFVPMPRRIRATPQEARR